MFLKKLPNAVEIGGVKYDINSDFRTSLKFEQMIQSSDMNKEETLYEGLNLYYPVRPKNEKDAIEKMLWFYLCGETGGQGAGKNEKPLYSAEQDFKYIYAAFKEQYDIDLIDEDMHWWKFRALFLSLNDCMFQRIMGYRAVDLKKLPLEDRKRYRDLKKIFALQSDITEEDKIYQNDLENALMQGKDIAELLKKARK